MRIKIVIHEAEEGGYWAEVPAFPGCVTEGETMRQLMRNLRDAVEGWLAVASRSAKVSKRTKAKVRTVEV